MLAFKYEAHWFRQQICFTQITNLDANLIQEHAHRHSQNQIWANIWAPQWSNQVNTVTVTVPIKKVYFKKQSGGKDIEKNLKRRNKQAKSKK